MSRKLAFCLSLLSTTAGSSWTSPVSGGEVEVEGDLEVIVRDDFEGQRAEHAYYVRDLARGLFRIHPAGSPPHPPRTGQRVSVKGRLSSEAVEEATVETASFAPGEGDTSGSTG